MNALTTTLAEVNDYLVDRSDVIDGEAGPLPNTEMTMQREVSAALDLAEKMVALLRKFAALEEGLANGNSGAEDAATTLAGKARALLGMKA